MKLIRAYCYSFLSILQIKPLNILFLLRVYFSWWLGLQTPGLVVKNINFDMDKSFIRWGDGETMIMLGIPFVFSSNYEKSNKVLSLKLEKIFYNTSENILLGLPIKYITLPENQTDSLRCWIITRNIVSKLNLNRLYGDAFFFRDLNNYNEFVNLYKNYKIFLISNEKNINAAINHGGLDIIGTYTIPRSNSFDIYHTIENDVGKLLSLIKIDNLRVLIAGGPIAKILVDSLTYSHYICHDVGAVFYIHLGYED